MDLELSPEGSFEKRRLERLIKLQHSDTGFFLLGTHSYIESWLRQQMHLWDEGFSFSDLLFRYKISLIEDAKSFPEQLSVLQTLRSKDKTAIAVRQNFVEISKEEAAASAYRLLQFCSLAGIDQPDELAQIREILVVWEDRGIIPDDELSALRRKNNRKPSAKRKPPYRDRRA